MNVSTGPIPERRAPNAQDLLTVAEVATELKLARKTIADWIRAGTLPALRIGRERRVLRSTLSEFLAEKAQDAREEASQKRREQNCRDELRRLQSLEPEQHWQEVNCISCLAPANASRHQRLDGRALCEDCTVSVRSDGFTKEMWDRQVALEVRERNAALEELPDVQMDHMERVARGLPIEAIRVWITYRCGYCDRPRAIRRAGVLDQSYQPVCGHEAPFGKSPMSVERLAEESSGAERRSMLVALTELEIREREIDAGLHPMEFHWQIGPCALCEEELAIVDHDTLMTGKGICRQCYGQKIDAQHQRHAILKVLQRHYPRDSFHLSYCECKENRTSCEGGGSDLSWLDASGTWFRLSWCCSRESDDLQALAKPYAERVGLSDKATASLMEDVTQHALDDLPF